MEILVSDEIAEWMRDKGLLMEGVPMLSVAGDAWLKMERSLDLGNMIVVAEAMGFEIKVEGVRDERRSLSWKWKVWKKRKVIGGGAAVSYKEMCDEINAFMERESVGFRKVCETVKDVYGG